MVTATLYAVCPPTRSSNKVLVAAQNIGPFYGLAVGDFPDGQGGGRVECGARVVAEVDTKNRLGKVDGRFPVGAPLRRSPLAPSPPPCHRRCPGVRRPGVQHWVSPYLAGSERFSLIYYQTEGEPYPLPVDLLAELREWNTG